MKKIMFTIFLYAGILLAGQPMPGQIVIDPVHPQWLKYEGGGPFFMCGPGDPEGFLYRGTRQADGTRDGDQLALIQKMQNTNANSIYMIAVRSNGGDGDDTENPYINSDPSQGLNQNILNQWETWFSAMEDAGIVVYFIFYDDGASLWNTGDNVGAAEQNFLETIVNQFEHHKNLIWCIAEEYAEQFSPQRISNIAAVIKNSDDHNHVVAVHKNHGLDFSELADDPNIDQFAIQYNVSSAEELHAGMLTAWNDANGRYNLNMAESYEHGSGESMRRKNWAVAMGGAYVMVLFMDIESTSIADLNSCGYLRTFFEKTDFASMAPHDNLKIGTTEYVLANPGKSYILYSKSGGDLGVSGLTQGTYKLLWFDTITGDEVEYNNVTLGSGNNSFTVPGSFSNEIALYIKKVSGTNDPPPEKPQNVQITN